MRIILTVVGSLGLCTSAIAGPNCTTEPESKWMTKAQMMDHIKPLGHTVDVFKKTKGNCYEIYGKTREGKRVEVYFHPITGAVVKVEEL